MANTPEGTQYRIDALARPEYFTLAIDIAPVIKNNLSDEEYSRLVSKVSLVQDSCQRLCANMLKGTLKYDRDDWPLEVWFDHIRDEAIDMVNYASLMEEPLEKALSNSSGRTRTGEYSNRPK